MNDSLESFHSVCRDYDLRGLRGRAVVSSSSLLQENALKKKSASSDLTRSYSYSTEEVLLALTSLLSRSTHRKEMNSGQIRGLLDELDQLEVVLTSCSLNIRSRTAIIEQICEILQVISLCTDEMQMEYRLRSTLLTGERRPVPQRVVGIPVPSLKPLERKIQIEK